MSKAFAPLLRHGARRGLPSKAGFSRRDALRFGAGGLAGALLAPITGCASRNSRGRNSTRTVPTAIRAPRTVVVIGAGFGGLACADTLAHGGVNVVLLEASGRAGGRVRTNRAFVPGDNVELGGEWIGSNHPTWLEYAQEFSLRLEEPGAPPEPSGVGEAATEVGTEPGGPATPAAPFEGAPRPEPFETEMETPPTGEGAAEDPEPQAAARTRAVLAAVLQPADSPGPIPADERPAPTDPPTKSEADAIVPVDPPAEQQPGDQDNTQPATQPATDEAATQPAEGDEPLILNGKLLRGEEADKLYEEVDGVLAKLIELARGVDPVRPWTSPNAEQLDARSFASFVEEQQGLSEEARALLIHGAEADNGVPAERMSLLGFLAMIAGGGFQDYFELSEMYRLAEGNDALAVALAQKLGPRVQFDAMVDAVRRTPEGVFVRTRDGRIFRGDAVVLATPPSVWGKIEFFPPLPEALTPQMGNNVKLLLALREPVWERQGLTADVTSVDTRPPADLPRPATVRQWMGLTWASTEPGRRGPVGLTLFAGASEAEEMRRLPPTERNAWALRSLQPAYPNLDDVIVRDRFIDWTGFPLTRASYSFPAPGQVTALGPVLVDGIDDGDLPPLLFAGEHTSFAFIGYMEGALSSGVRVGRALLGTATPPPAREVLAETLPAKTQPVEAQPVPESAPEAAPADEPEPVAPGLPV